MEINNAISDKEGDYNSFIVYPTSLLVNIRDKKKSLKLLYFPFLSGKQKLFDARIEKMFSIIRITRTLSSRACQPVATFQKFDEFTQKAEETVRQNESKRQRADEDEEIKSKILKSALTFVPDHGWSKDSITKGVEAVGFPKVTSGMIEPIELIHFHYESSNDALEDLMKKEVEALKDDEKLSTTKFLRKHVENRLRMNAPYLSQWPHALAMMSLPQNAPKSLHFGLTMVDSMWHYAGDKSLDYNWYTKRITLLGIYKSTELAMMQDSDKDDFKNTWDFLDRRFEDLRDLSGIMKGGPQDLGKMVNSIGTTLKVLIGLPR